MLPLSGDALEGPPHERVLIEDSVEVIDREWEQVAISLGSDAGNTPGVGQQTYLAEVGAVAQTGGNFPVAHDYVHDTLLDKVHFRTDGGFLDDDVTCEQQRTGVRPELSRRRSMLAARINLPGWKTS